MHEGLAIEGFELVRVMLSSLAGVVSPVFVGRQAELSATRELVDATAHGESGLSARRSAPYSWPWPAPPGPSA
jgi:hypothetical protein